MSHISPQVYKKLVYSNKISYKQKPTFTTANNASESWYPATHKMPAFPSLRK